MRLFTQKESGRRYNNSRDLLNLPTLSSYSKKVLTTIMVVFPLALVVDQLISPFIAGLPSLAITMIFILIMAPILTILMPMVTKLLEKLMKIGGQ